jgi:hypothetical protein
MQVAAQFRLCRFGFLGEDGGDLTQRALRRRTEDAEKKRSKAGVSPTEALRLL